MGARCTLGGNVKWYTHIRKQYDIFSKIKNRTTICHSDFTTGDIYIKKLKAGSPRHICTCMFRVALFTIANKWKKPKYPLMAKWINKMWFTHTEEYRLVLKGRKFNMCYNIHEPWGYYAKWNKPVTKRQILTNLLIQSI